MTSRRKAPVDTRPGIFDKLFHCRTSYKASRSIDSIRATGMPTTGDEEIDRDMHHQAVDRWITINDVVELFRQNLEVAVISRSDTPIMYKCIMDHLQAWEYDMNHEFSPAKPPLEDLALMYRLADKLYHYVRYEVDAGPLDELGKFFGDAVDKQAMLKTKMPSFTALELSPNMDGLADIARMGFDTTIPKAGDQIKLSDAFERRIRRRQT